MQTIHKIYKFIFFYRNKPIVNGNKVIKDNFSKKVDKNLKFSDESEAYNQFRSNAHFTPHPGQKLFVL